MSNLVIGSKFERDFCKLLVEHGFYSLRIPKNAGGQQPADVLAVKGRYHALIDCKVISGMKHGFDLRRVEDNQRTAMKLFAQKGGENGWFAICLPNLDIRMLALQTIEAVEMHGKHSLNLAELSSPDFTWSFEQWLGRGEAWM